MPPPKNSILDDKPRLEKLIDLVAKKTASKIQSGTWLTKKHIEDYLAEWAAPKDGGYKIVKQFVEAAEKKGPVSDPARIADPIATALAKEAPLNGLAGWLDNDFAERLSLRLNNLPYMREPDLIEVAMNGPAKAPLIALLASVLSTDWLHETVLFRDICDMILEKAEKDSKFLQTVQKLHASVASGEEKIKSAKPEDGHTSRNSFVGSSVKENSIAQMVINKIYPYFPKNCKVISAWLSTSDLYWKVNYHWDALRTWLEYAKDNDLMSDEEKKKLGAMYKTLMSNAPSKTGHYKIDKLGEPEDTSPESKTVSRCQILNAVKRELKSYMAKQGFTSRKLKFMDLLKYSVEPVSPPAKSNHSTGWALDIAGPDLNEVIRIATMLGASKIIKEYPHCHCEFAGAHVKTPR